MLDFGSELKNLHCTVDQRCSAAAVSDRWWKLLGVLAPLLPPSSYLSLFCIPAYYSYKARCIEYSRTKRRYRALRDANAILEC